MEEIMLKLSEIHHNYHPSGVKMLVKFFRRGIRVIIFFESDNVDEVSRLEYPARKEQ